MKEILEKLNLSEEAIDKFITYKDILLEYNHKMNLTAITEEREIALKHFSDSLTPLSLADFKNKKVIDVGTGAGFPGVPLKIAEPSIKLTLLDSLNKRISFLNAAIDALNLDNTAAVHLRAEEGARTDLRESFDIAVSRAVADLRILAEFCLPYVKQGGCFIVMKGPNPEEEINSAKKAIAVLGGKIEKIEKITISDFSRTLVLIRKVRATPKSYPRSFAKIKKTPL
ncbi:MAG: 16S rRNA (guanine(527)-N(7))-methyltransferase RsmG [Clostridiales bacterium]|nr:16S rRNA (guanine(527)-N(7))-methyltransferase RsmG [Clostridiales bacterium]